VLTDDNSGEPLDKLAFGVIGDLADAFPNGDIKPLLLSEWIASSLVSRKGYDKETKTTIKWAREVRRVSSHVLVCLCPQQTAALAATNRVDGQALNSVRQGIFCTTQISHFPPSFLFLFALTLVNDIPNAVVTFFSFP
jgi:hypothetical protein